MTVNIITHKASETLRNVIRELGDTKYSFVGYRRSDKYVPMTFEYFMELMQCNILLGDLAEDYVDFHHITTKRGLAALQKDVRAKFYKDLESCTHKQIYSVLSQDFSKYMVTSIVHDSSRGIIIVGVHEDLSSFVGDDKETRRARRDKTVAELIEKLDKEESNYEEDQ